MGIGPDEAVYAISVAAELAGMHPQTLRQYDRMGLVVPRRTRGRGRRYSPDDIAKLRLIQRLSQDEGINLAGIQKILELQRQVEFLDRQNALLRDQLDDAMDEVRRAERRVFAAGSTGDVVTIHHGKRPDIRIAGALLPGTTGRNATAARGSFIGESGVSGPRGELVVYRSRRTR